MNPHYDCVYGISPVLTHKNKNLASAFSSSPIGWESEPCLVDLRFTPQNPHFSKNTCSYLRFKGIVFGGQVSYFPSDAPKLLNFNGRGVEEMDMNAQHRFLTLTIHWQPSPSPRYSTRRRRSYRQPSAVASRWSANGGLHDRRSQSLEAPVGSPAPPSMRARQTRPCRVRRSMVDTQAFWDRGAGLEPTRRRAAAPGEAHRYPRGRTAGMRCPIRRLLRGALR